MSFKIQGSKLAGFMFYCRGNLKITSKGNSQFFLGDWDDLFSRVLKFAILVAIIVRLVILNDEYILLGVVIFSSKLLHSCLEGKSGCCYFIPFDFSFFSKINNCYFLRFSMHFPSTFKSLKK